MRDLNFWKDKLDKASQECASCMSLLSAAKGHKRIAYKYSLPKAGNRWASRRSVDRRLVFKKRLFLETQIGTLQRRIKQLSEVKIPYIKSMIERLESK